MNDLRRVLAYLLLVLAAKALPKSDRNSIAVLRQFRTAANLDSSHQ